MKKYILLVAIAFATTTCAEAQIHGKMVNPSGSASKPDTIKLSGTLYQQIPIVSVPNQPFVTYNPQVGSNISLAVQLFDTVTSGKLRYTYALEMSVDSLQVPQKWVTVPGTTVQTADTTAAYTNYMFMIPNPAPANYRVKRAVVATGTQNTICKTTYTIGQK